MDPLALTLMALVAGGLVGSLVNVIATRLPAHVALIGPPLRASDDQPSPRGFIPFVGAWTPGLGLDWPKLGTELGAVAAVAVALLRHGWTFEGLRAAVFATCLLLILRIDWQNHLIFMITIVPGVVVALALNATSFRSLMSAGAGGLAAAFVFLLLFLVAVAIYRKRALGFGDVLLAGLIGSMTGLSDVVLALMLGMLLASVGGLFLIAIRVRARTDYIPYGAYLSLGAMIVVLLSR